MRISTRAVLNKATRISPVVFMPTTNHSVTVQGCHGQGKVREKQKFFKVREKSGNFAKSQGKSQFLSKSVKSQGILFSGWRKVL